LIEVLDHTATSMGARLLREWLCRPLVKARPILDRLDAVEELSEDAGFREALRERLKKVYDLERLNSRVALGRAHPRDILALRDSFAELPGLKDLLLSCTTGLLKRLSTGLDTLEDVGGLIEQTLRDDAPISLAEGGVIRKGVHPELDQYLDATRNNKEWIAALEAREKAATGIPSLKVGYNKVFGYYIEVTRTHFDKIPPNYVRKQTLVNAERFITEELKDRETIILEAREKQTQLEHDLFVDLRERIAAHSGRIRATAAALAHLDVLGSLAHAAQVNGYAKPEILEAGEISIREGRHPVVERSLPPGEFVPNDVRLDMENDQILVVTGPNMAGKSTILRQTALITLMAQIGSFVPALEARIGLVDRIFTRIGASDDLFRGYSTFMIEMVETATIVHQATPRSLVILDEIGRGTSTVDGLSIAWAVVEYLHNRRGRGVKTLFATHYHELTQLSRLLPRVKNFNIAVKEWQGNVLFLRKLVRGGASHSYGIEVARLAGLPRSIIDRSREILTELESCGLPEIEAASPKKGRRASSSRARQVPFEFLDKQEGEVEKRLRDLNPDMLSPREALQLLYELKQLSDKEA
jgi:DNA mismatch repair protein MutS